MMIKFLRHGLGDPGRAAAYLINDRDHLDRDREHVEVLRGDPATFVALARSSPHKYRYSSAVIAWAKEDAPTDQQINDVLNEFELHAHAGLKRNQYHMTAVLHVSDDQSKHIHVLFPRIELTSKKSLNVAPPGHLHYFDLLRDYFNHRYQWARPDDSARFKELQLPHHIQKQNAFYLSIKKGVPVKKHRLEIIHQYVQAEIKHGTITDRPSLLKKLSEIGEITRCNDSFITIKTKSGVDRLKGEIYESTFNSTKCSASKLVSDEYARNDRTHDALSINYLERMLTGRKKREEYNKNNYADRSVDRKISQQSYNQKSGIKAAQQSNGVAIESVLGNFYEGHSTKVRGEFGNQDTFKNDMSSATGSYSNVPTESATYSNKVRFNDEPQSAIRNNPSLHYITKKITEMNFHDSYNSYGGGMYLNHKNNHGEQLNERYKPSNRSTDSTPKDREFATTKEFTTTRRIGRKTMPYSEFFRKISEQSDRAKQFFEERERAAARDHQLSKANDTGERSTARYTKFDRSDARAFISGIKKTCDQFITSGRDQNSDPKSTQSISTRDAEVVSNQLEQFGVLRQQIESEVHGFIEQIRFSEHGFGKTHQGVQKMIELLKTSKFPKCTFEKRLNALRVNNPVLITLRCLKNAENADFVIECQYKSLMKPRYLRTENLISDDFFKDVQRMFNEIKKNIMHIKEDDYASLYEINELANHYVFLIIGLYQDEDVKSLDNIQKNKIKTITDQFRDYLDSSKTKYLTYESAHFDKSQPDRFDKNESSSSIKPQNYNDLSF